MNDKIEKKINLTKKKQKIKIKIEIRNTNKFMIEGLIWKLRKINLTKSSKKIKRMGNSLGKIIYDTLGLKGEIKNK